MVRNERGFRARNLQNGNRRWLYLILAAGVAVIGLLASAVPVDAHGAATRPGSRTYLCRVDGTHASGDIEPSNAACAAAVALGGKQPLWDWFGVLRADGAGRTEGYIPDGQLCSGGEPKFAGYDLPRSDWPYTRLTAGASFTIRYNAWAAHPGEFRLYITKDGFDPTQPLAWDDLEDEPFSVWNQSAPNGQDGQNNTPDYQWDVTLPNKTGQHIIYSVWSRSDSDETFYGCSDVRFDGGTGQVVGVGAGATPVGAPSGGAAPVTPTPADQTPTPSTAAPAADDPGYSDPAADDGATGDSGATGDGTATNDGTDGDGYDGTGQDGQSTSEGSDQDQGSRSERPMTESEQQASAVAGSEVATDGATAPPAEQTVLAPTDGQAPLDGTDQVSNAGAEGISDGSESDVLAAPIAQQGSGGVGLITIIAVAIAGLATGVAISVVAFSSPRARNAYRRLIGDEQPSPRPVPAAAVEPEPGPADPEATRKLLVSPPQPPQPRSPATQTRPPQAPETQPPPPRSPETQTRTPQPPPPTQGPAADAPTAEPQPVAATTQPPAPQRRAEPVAPRPPATSPDPDTSSDSDRFATAPHR